MFTKLAIALLAATSALAGGSGNGSCGTKGITCCSQVQDPHSADYASMIKSLASQGLLKDIGVPVQGIAIPIGVSCIPVTVIGGQVGQNCQNTATCCDRVTDNGIGVDCTPLGVNV